MGKKVKLDWESIELAYRANVKTVAQIAAEFDVKDSTLRSRAKRNGWKRDLKARIKSAADVIVNANAVKREVSRIEDMEASTVEENAQLTAGVRLSHRKDINRARVLTMNLLGDLEAQVGTEGRLDLAELFIKALESGDVDGSALEAYERVTSLTSHVRIMKDLADTMTKFVTLERQAYGLDDMDSSPVDALTTLLHSIANSNGNAFGVVKDDPEYGDAPATNSIGVKSDVDD